MSKAELNRLCAKVDELLREIEANSGVEQLANSLEDASSTLMIAMIARAQQAKHLEVSEVTKPYLEEAWISLQTALDPLNQSSLDEEELEK